MQFSEIVAPTVKELFVQKVETAILSGELAIGDKLPSERELAEQMKISKTAVHSGITDMVRKGFLEVIPRKGIFVGDYVSNGTLEALVSIMEHDSCTLDSRNIRSILEIRSAIESIAVEHVAERRNEKTIRKLESILAEARKLADISAPSSEVAEKMFAFHHAVCVESGNIIIPLIFNAFRVPAIRMWTSSFQALGPEESIGRMEVLLDKIKAGDCISAVEYIQWICRTSDGIVKE